MVPPGSLFAWLIGYLGLGSYGGRNGVAVAWDRHPAAESGLGIRSSTGAWVATAMDPLINKLD